MILHNPLVFSINLCQYIYSTTLMYTENEIFVQASEQQLDYSHPSEHSLIKHHLQKVSATSSRYQIQAIIVLCLVWVNITYTSMIGSFVFMNPLIQCDTLPTSEHDACLKLQKCTITNQFTATYTHKLICKQESTRLQIQSVFAIGCLLGLFFLPMLSDWKGRKLALLVGLILQILGTVILLWGLKTDTHFLMKLGHFFVGVFAAGCSILTYVVSSEICSDYLRQSSIMIYNAVWGFCEISYYFIYYHFADWQNYLFYLILIPAMITFLLVFIFIDQTPDFTLIIKASYPQYRSLIKKMAQTNSMEQQKIQKLIPQKIPINTQVKKEVQQSESSLKKILNDSQTIKTISLLATALIGYNLFYFGMQGSMERTGYNFGVSMLLAGSHEFIGYALASIIISFLPRKKGIILFNTITVCLGIGFGMPVVSHSFVLQSIIISLIRMTCVFSYSLLSVLQTESFKPELKSTSIGMTMGISQIGRIIVPYLINYMNQIGLHPLVASSFLYLIMGIIPMFFVKNKIDGENLLAAKTSQESQRLFDDSEPQKDEKVSNKSSTYSSQSLQTKVLESQYLQK